MDASARLRKSMSRIDAVQIAAAANTHDQLPRSWNLTAWGPLRWVKRHFRYDDGAPYDISTRGQKGWLSKPWPSYMDVPTGHTQRHRAVPGVYLGDSAVGEDRTLWLLPADAINLTWLDRELSIDAAGKTRVELSKEDSSATWTRAEEWFVRFTCAEQVVNQLRYAGWLAFTDLEQYRRKASIIPAQNSIGKLFRKARVRYYTRLITEARARIHTGVAMVQEGQGVVSKLTADVVRMGGAVARDDLDHFGTLSAEDLAQRIVHLLTPRARDGTSPLSRFASPPPAPPSPVLTPSPSPPPHCFASFPSRPSSAPLAPSLSRW